MRSVRVKKPIFRLGAKKRLGENMFRGAELVLKPALEAMLRAACFKGMRSSYGPAHAPTYASMAPTESSRNKSFHNERSHDGTNETIDYFAFERLKFLKTSRCNKSAPVAVNRQQAGILSKMAPHISRKAAQMRFTRHSVSMSSLVSRSSLVGNSPRRNFAGLGGFACAAIAAASILTLSVAAPIAAHAQDNQPSTVQQLNTADDKKPMLLQADEVVYDNQNNRVLARGNVEIYYNNYALLADKVSYDQNTKKLTAEGNVRIKEPSGAVINADRITLTDDFREGFIRSLKIVTAQDARIAAKRATRKEGNVTVFEKGIFTPCKPCKDNPKKAPLWRIKAYKVIHKKDEGNIYYEDAVFELLGVPIAYVPFFYHADPTVKRRSGFLTPKYSQSDDLGTMVEIPYYFALAPNYDFTFSPAISTKRGILWKGDWRHRLATGSYRIKMAGIADNKYTNPTTGREEDFRGSIETQGIFKIGELWEWGWDVTYESDDTFRRFYKIDNVVRTDRVSKVFVIGQGDRNYFEGNLYQFGGLLADDTPTSEPRVHPVIDYNHIFRDPFFGGELSFDANLLSLSRSDGADTNRITASVNWRRTYIDNIGQVLTPFAHLRGDAYKVSNVIDPITNVKGEAESFTRGMATAGATYSYPMVAHTSTASHILEPVGQIIARPNTSNEKDVPNEDSQSLVFDDTLLFDTDKFSGYDRLETGIRANVGLQYTMQMYSGGYARAVIGESFHIDGDNPFSVDSGLGKTRSDFVTGLYYEPNKYISMIAQGRFDQDDVELKRTDLYIKGDYGPVSGSVNYANIKAQPSLGVTSDREEILASAAVQVAKNWNLFGHMRYDIEGNQRISDSLGLKYADDCFILSVSYTENFIRDRDIEPSQTISVRFELKHLGGNLTKTDAIDDPIPDSDASKS